MAKENYALLIGELQSSPIINEEKQRAKYSIKTLRRNDKIDFPIISVLEEDLIEKARGFKTGDFILVKGLVSTQEVKKGVICPHCQEINRVEGTTTEVIAIEHISIGKKYSLEGLKEISNQVMVLGSLCRDPEYRILKNSSIGSCQYQLAVNRKFNVKRQPHIHTDYPWVNSFGRQADQDAVRLVTGSQVFIQGGLQTRQIQKNMSCTACQGAFQGEDQVAEIVPYSVEYLNNCKFDQEETEQSSE